VYYAKVEPYTFYNLSSDVMGIVEKTDENLLGKVLHNEVFIQIDDTLDKEELQYTVEKIEDLQNTLELSSSMLENLHKVLIKKQRNYKKVEAMRIKSRIEKDREFYDLIATQNSYIATKKEINSLKIQIADLLLRKKTLQKTLHDKKLQASHLLLYSIDVKEGQFVNKGTPLAKLADISKALLTLYVNKNDLEKINQKSIYIDGIKTSYKVSRSSNIADTINLSKYKVQIVIHAPKIFSQLVKIEFKEEKH
jgi:multidrug efflux pump subunit AcrA (membrane-fusion protein)